MTECHVRFIYNTNAFLFILGIILGFWPQNYQNSTGFIRYFHQLFRTLQNVVLLTVFDVLPNRKTHSTFTDKPNAFLILFGAILQKWTQKYQ